MFTYRFIHIAAIALGSWLALSSCVAPASARTDRQVSVPLTRFDGQVTNIQGPAGNPTGFTLQLHNRFVDLRVAPNATFTAHSAEAQVGGFQVNDYAIVLARKVRKLWTATRIDFDIQPIVPGQVTVTFSGTILKVMPNLKRFSVRADTGDVRWINIVPKTRFRASGLVTDSALVLIKGNQVQIIAVRNNKGLFASEIDLKTSVSPRP